MKDQLGYGDADNPHSGFRRFIPPSAQRRLALAITLALIVLPIVAFFSTTLVYAASTINVNTTADENGTGAGCSLREAIATANTNTNTGGCTGAAGSPFTINVPAGTYTLTSLGELQVGTVSGTSISIVGASAATTIINAASPSNATCLGAGTCQRVFSFDPNIVGNVTVNVSNATITGGVGSAFGGGGILGGWAGNSTTLSNVIITGNSTAGSNQGGGVSWADGGNLTINNSTISNNTSDLLGGGVAVNQGTTPGNLSITNSLFSNNKSLQSLNGATKLVGQGGGLYFALMSGSSATISDSSFTNNQAETYTDNTVAGQGGAIYIGNGNVTITGTNFTGNSAQRPSAGGGIGQGGAIYDGGSNPGAINYNRFVGNTAASGSGIFRNLGNAGTDTATNNWWGCNTGPSAAPCNTVVSGNSGAGSIIFDPWIVLTNTANPNPINRGQATTLTASFLKNSVGTSLLPTQIKPLIGLPVTWNNAVNGSLSGQQAAIQISGTATATFTNNNTCANGSADAIVDGVTVTAAVTVPCIDLTATKTNSVSGNAVVGQSWNWVIKVDNIGNTAATFTNGQTILSDNLPNTTTAYGLTSLGGVTNVTGGANISCAIASSNLTCVAIGGPVTIGPSTGSFLVSFVATPSAVGTYANPRSGGSCSVDPSSLVTEDNNGSTGETNNGCSNSVTVSKANTTTTISADLPDPSVVGQTVTVSYTVAVTAPGAGTPTGNVTVSDGTDSCTGTVAAGKCVITLTTLGSRTLTATYAGDTNFNTSSSTGAGHTVNQISTTTTITTHTPDPSVVGQAVPILFTVAPVAPGAGTPTGNVTVTDGFASCTASVAAGQCSLLFTTAGSKTLTAVYSGDTNNSGSTSANVAHTVNKASTITTITADTPDPSVVGQTVTVTFTVAPVAPGAGTPTGNVTVGDGTISCMASVAVGKCTLTFTTAGTKTLTATYAGDADFSTSISAGVQHTVNQATTITTITADTPDPSVVGQTVTVTFTVAPVAPGAGTPTGNVTVSDGTVSCTATVAAGKCTLTFTTVGSKTLTATYAGDTNFSTSTSAGELHTVTQVGTTTTITADTPDPSLVGQSVTVTYSVIPTLGSGTPTGNVTVSDGTVSCTATVAAGQCALTFTTAGARTLTATYAGDTDNSGSTSANVTHMVNKASTITTITADAPDPSVVGQTVTVTFTVAPIAPGAGTPTGNVTVSDGTASCTGTVATGTCTLTFTSVGSKTLTATYAGDADFSTSTSAGVQHTVNQAATTTTITADTPDPSVVGQTVTVTFTVAPVAPGAGTPTGNVTVNDGTISCMASVAVGKCTLTFTSAGSRTLTATYVGDTNFSGSTSVGEPHTVNQAATVTTITADTPDPSVVGQTVTVSFTVAPVAPGAGTPTGNVTVSDGTVSCTASVAVGKCTLTFTSAGSKTLTATYAGDTNFSTSTSAGAPHTVNLISTTTTITADTPDPSVVGESVTVQFTVVPIAPGTGTPTGNVTVSDGTVSCTATVAAGQCALTFTSVGSKTLTATYAGDSDNSTSTSATVAHTVNQAATVTTITADTPDPSVVGQTVTVTFTVAAVAPGAGTPTGNVTVSDGTISCTASVAVGVCPLTFTSAGARTLTATYAGDTNFVGSASATAAHTVNQAATVTMITADTPDPSLIGETVTVTFTVAPVAPGAGTPTGNVTVSDGTVSCTGTVAAGHCTITFTSAGAKTLTATYAGDANFSGSTSAGEPHGVNTPGVRITPTTVGVTEGGATATYQVVLTSQVSADVTIAIATDGQTTVSPTSLTFTAANWNVPQNVTVTAVDDTVAEGAHTSTITHSATSSDTNYNGITIVNVTATVADNDSASVSVAPTGVNVTEGGATATYAVVLTTQPTADVTVAVTTDGQTTASPTSLTFTAANWNVPQNVTVTAVDDTIDEGPHTSTITHSATSSDANYNGITIASVTASITDNDTAGVSVTPTSVSVTEGGATATYTVALKSQPTADVTIAVTTDRQTTASPTSLTFTTANWNVPQTVTVTAVDDTVVEGTHSSTISHRATSSDAKYNDISIENVTPTITDNDSAPTTFRAYIPIVVQGAPTTQPEPTGLPDLIVDRINITKTNIEVVIRNQGTAAVTGPFWVDAYINPNPVPTKVNQIWPYLARQGMVWAVTSGALPLAPGGTLTLTVGDGLYRADLSTLPSSLAAGAQVYVQVDSANANTNYGGVLETHEQNGGAYNNISSATVPAGGVKFNAVPAVEGRSEDTHLPSRPIGSQ